MYHGAARPSAGGPYAWITPDLRIYPRVFEYFSQQSLGNIFGGRATELGAFLAAVVCDRNYSAVHLVVADHRNFDLRHRMVSHVAGFSIFSIRVGLVPTALRGRSHSLKGPIIRERPIEARIQPT
jgi:hypothetical protein